jgi:hypothetical protein
MPMIAPPEIADSELLFDETETRDILVFFWPQQSATICSMTVTDEVRRFGQSILIAAIDASYAMGYVEALFKTVANHRGGVKKLAQKLARRFIQHWWKHAKVQDLRNVRIYEDVRLTISRNYRSAFEILRSAGKARVRTTPVLMAGHVSGRCWV